MLTGKYSVLQTCTRGPPKSLSPLVGADSLPSIFLRALESALSTRTFCSNFFWLDNIQRLVARNRQGLSRALRKSLGSHSSSANYSPPKRTPGTVVDSGSCCMKRALNQVFLLLQCCTAFIMRHPGLHRTVFEAVASSNFFAAATSSAL